MMAPHQPVAAQDPVFDASIGMSPISLMHRIHNGFQVYWQPPQGIGDSVTDYDLHYREYDDDTSRWGTWTDSGHTGTATFTLLTGLKADTTYQTRVRSWIGHRYSRWSVHRSTVNQGSTRNFQDFGRPDPPTVPTATASTGKITVSWTDPGTANNSVAITEYQVAWRSDSDTTYSARLPATTTTYDIVGVTAHTEYEVWIRAHAPRSGGRTGSSSSPVAEVLTVENPPPALCGGATSVSFDSATYSGTEGGTIGIRLSLAEAQSEPVCLHVRPEYSSVASYSSDYSLGDCLPDEDSCDFGVGMLDVRIPAGATTYRYDIRTEDDHRVEGDETFTLGMYVWTRSVTKGDNSQAVITITDNDTAGVVVSAETVEVEEGISGSYTVKLSSQPDGWVRIYATSANECKVTVSPGAVTLDRNSWNTPQKFDHVRAWTDEDAADEEVVITHRIETSSRAAEYGAVEVDSVTVEVDDKHSPGVVVETTSLSPSVGETAAYRVYLNADPSPIYGDDPSNCYDYDSSKTVIITATSSDPAVASVSPASVTFDADNYDPESFVVTAVKPGTATITHTVSGTDPDYTSGTIIVQGVTVEVTAPLAPQQSQPSSLHTTSPDEALSPPVAVPGPVLGLKLVATADSLTASWQAPDTGDATNRYIVHLKPVGGGKGATKRPKAKKTEVTFKNLQAGTAYNVFVRAKNEAGKGPRSQTIITLPDA